MFELRSPVRHYAWGDNHSIATLTGQSADGTPWAELWMGAHDDDPSLANLSSGDTPLNELITSDPEALLGERIVAEHGSRLPFLAKFLAAGTPLSLQVHPNVHQAREGFAAEEAAGVPHDAPHRRYKDPLPKPEILMALTAFTALAGLRSPKDVCRELEDSAPMTSSATLRPILDIVVEAAEADSWENVFTKLLHREVETPSAEFVAAVAELSADADHPASITKRLHELYPNDPGIIIAFCMNLVHLEPGQGLYIPAGIVHSYVRGLGLEVMAASDNVLRAGLTAKYVDVDELLSLADLRPAPAPVVTPETTPSGLLWPAGESYFRVLEFAAEGVDCLTTPGDDATVAIAIDGSLEVTNAGRTLHLAQGSAAFLPPSEIKYTLQTSGRAACVSVPTSALFSTGGNP